jgi:hypothetical protein
MDKRKSKSVIGRKGIESNKQTKKKVGVTEV